MNDIYAYVQAEKAAFKKLITVIEGWDFNFSEHIRRSILYKNSQFYENNENRELRPNKNIVRPILNIAYRTEGFDVKDIELYVDNPDEYHKSFLLKKFHDKWALENGMDTFIDEVVESFVDFGGALVKDLPRVRPEVVNLQSVCLCDATSILAGALALEHKFSPAELREEGEKLGWGKEGATITIEDLIQKVLKEKDGETSTYIKIYEVHGVFPESWLGGDYDKEKTKYIPQVHIISYYKGSNNEDQGVTLFAKKEPKLPFKFLKRDPIYGRALGFGGVEELFEPQIWTNFSIQKQTEMLEHASKIVHWTNDPAFKNRNRINDLEQGELLTLNQGSQIGQIDTFPRNLIPFMNFEKGQEAHAQQLGSAPEPALGESPSAGTPFKLYEAQLIEGQGIHKFRQGRLAVFMDEIYRDWILPKLAKEVVKGSQFLVELSSDEMMELADKISLNQVNKMIIEKILNGELINKDEMDMMREKIKEDFLAHGNKKFIEILKDDLGENLAVRTNIVGKQKNLAQITDKMVNLVRQLIATPQVRQDPEMMRWLNMILESSGISPISFQIKPAPVQGQAQSGTTEPLKKLANYVQ